MLTENRKRRRGNDGEEDPDNQAKRSGGGRGPLVSELGRDAWDSEQSSSSDSSGVVSSPVRAAPAGAGLCPHTSNNCVSQNSLSPPPDDSSGSSLRGFHSDDGGSGAFYDHINRVLREAHFSSLQARGGPGST